MKDCFYFEQHPWDRACATIKTKDLGDVYEIAVQAVCETGTCRKTLQTWLERCKALIGDEITGDTLERAHLISFVGRNTECIIRIFIDESDTEPTENFEIVTEKALIVWKPGTSLQGRITNGYIGTQQKFMTELERNV